MRSKQIFFYVLKEDLVKILKSIESNFDIKYAEAGLMNERVSSIDSLASVEGIGNVDYGDWNHNKKYLLLSKSKSLQIREIPQKKGGIKYAIDQMKNEDSVVFYFGGLYKDDAIIASKIATISNTEFTKNIFKYISNYIKKNFKNVRGFYVSSGSLEKAKNGIRLTTDTNGSLDYDLVLTNSTNS